MINQNPIEISVIIVNYGTPELAIEAVESVLSRQHGGHSVSVHLLDNASPGNDAELFQLAYRESNWGDQVVLYLEKTNHGFGRGNNIVLKALAECPAPPDMVMLLNPDARLNNEAIGLQADFLEKHPSYAVVGPAIIKPDGTRVTSAFRFPNAASEFAQSVNFGPVSRFFKNKIVPLPPEHPSLQVDWVAGAAPLIRFSVFRDVGFFDPEYFLYFEEVDLMLQINCQGWKIGYLTDARVTHVEGASTGISSDEKRPKRPPSFWYYSWAHYYIKNHGRTGALVAAIAWCLGAGLNIIITQIRGKPTSTPKKFFRDFWNVAGRQILGLKVN